MVLRAIITVLCGVGLYASLFMLRKGAVAARGELTEPSVVQTPRARLVGGVPNSLLGVAYYPALAIAVWLADTHLALALLMVPVLAAAAISLVLAYSLLFVTRMPCVFCWTSHAINWSLALCTALLVASTAGQ
ncbi:MAG TPA: vitamin K epoxide reductase family protein [Candidatus Acidoferrum sp.]|nr:vitamin K epoxide reductase family protein [Candidatus Acidoferrum sp.]